MKQFIFFLGIILMSSCSYKLRKHPNNVYQLSKSGVNIYIIEQNNSFLMIDSGTPKQGEKIEKALLKNNLSPEKIKYLIITHAHHDHAGSASYFQQKFNTKLIIGKKDLIMINNHGKDNHLCPQGLFAKISKPFINNSHYLPFVPDILIDKNFDLKNIGFSGQIIPLAGHTPGSLLIKIDTSIFVGDLIRGGIINNTSPKTHFFMCNLEDNYKNIQFVSKIPNIKNWYLGHFGPIQKNDILKYIQDEKTKY